MRIRLIRPDSHVDTRFAVRKGLPPSLHPLRVHVVFIDQQLRQEVPRRPFSNELAWVSDCNSPRSSLLFRICSPIVFGISGYLFGGIISRGSWVH